MSSTHPPARGAGADADARWQLTPPATGARVLMFVLVVVLPLAVTAATLLLAMTGAPPADHAAAGPTPWMTLAMVALIVVVAWLALDRFGFARRGLRLDGATLEVRTGMRRHAYAIADLQLERARIVDLREHTALKARWRTNGIAAPGIRGGWFRLRDGSRALLATAGGDRVLWLPTRNGHALLLEPRSPQALLDRLRRMAATGAHG